MAKNDDNGFKTFWDAYGLKREKAAAEAVWRRLSPADRRSALAGIASYREDCKRRGVTMKYAQGYLSHRRWEDEIEEEYEQMEKW